MALQGERWYALYTKPHKEYLVRDLLRNLDVDVYLPEIRVTSPRRGRRDTKPFFPHYLFACFDLQDGVTAKIRYTPGVRRIVAAGGRPVPVTDEVVTYIRRRLAKMSQRKPEGPYQKGEKVRVVRGPFEGFDVVFDERLSPQGRVRVFLQLMDRLVAAEMDLGDLLPPH